VIKIELEIKRMNAAAIRGEKALEANLNAVLIYDDFMVAAQANGVLKRSAQFSDEAIQLNVRARPKLAQFAARHGLSFIFDHDGPTEEGLAPFVRRRQGREPTQAAPLRHLDEGGSHECHEGWDIHE